MDYYNSVKKHKKVHQHQDNYCLAPIHFLPSKRINITDYLLPLLVALLLVLILVILIEALVIFSHCL